MTTRLERPVDDRFAGWYDDITAIRREVRDLVEGLSAPQLTWRPAPGKWSIIECLDHLVATAREAGTHQAIAIQRGRAGGRTGSGPFGFGFLGRWFVRATGPDPTRPAPAPAIFAPGSDLDPQSVIAQFDQTQIDLQRLFHSADGLNLARIKARSAVSALIRINLAAWFASTVGHQRRHLQQIGRIKAHPQFPSR